MEQGSANVGWDPNRMRGVDFVGERQGGEQMERAERLGNYGERTELADPERPAAAQEQGAELNTGIIGGEQKSGQMEQGERKTDSNPLTVTFTEVAGVEQMGATPSLGAMPPTTEKQAVVVSTEMSNKEFKRMKGDTISKEYADKLKKAEKRDAADPALMQRNFQIEQAEAMPKILADGRKIGDRNGSDLVLPEQNRGMQMSEQEKILAGVI